MTPPDRAAAPKRSRVLLVESDAGDAELVQLWLRSARESQYDLWHVETLGDAEGCLAKASFDLALVDLSLPDASGPWAFHALRERHPDLPVIVFSSFSEAAVGERLLAEGACDHLVKGQMTGEVLIRSMRHGVTQGRLIRELETARARAFDAKRERAELLASLAQELRTPLHTVLGMADLLLETELTREQEGYVRSFLRASEGMLGRLEGRLASGAPDPEQTLRADGPLLDADGPLLDEPTVRAEPGTAFGIDPEHDLRILVADDSDESLDRLVAQLGGAGLAPITVGDGRAAVERYREDEFDLVLMDVQMPEMDGLEATREIRRIEAETGRPPATIVAVTGLTGDDHVGACLRAGCDDHLAKPVPTATLLELVTRHARKPHDRLVRVDGGSIDEVDLYLHERHNDLAALRFALEAEDLDSVCTVARSLEQSGQGRGFAELADLGRGLRKAAEAGNRAGVERGVADLGDFLREVKIIVG